MRRHTKYFLLHSPIDREHEILDKINRAETPGQINDLRLLISLEGIENPSGLLEQLKKREAFLKD